MPAASHFRHGFALYCWIHNYVIVRVKVCDDGTPCGSYIVVSICRFHSTVRKVGYYNYVFDGIWSDPEKKPRHKS